MAPEANHANDYRVLILPPTRRDAEVTRALLERAGLTCFVCAGVTELAAQIDTGPGAIVLTDAVLVDPLVNDVLAALSRQASWSDVPIILLSRVDTHSPAAARVLNALTNVTLLDRPTSMRTLLSTVQAAIRGRERQYQIRDHMREQLAAENALRNADRRKDEFLAMLAHELRNPLAPIRNASEILARTLPPDSKNQAMVGIVKRQVAHLTRLVDDLLDVSRITQGRIELQREVLELSYVVTQAMESVEPLLRKKGHRVTLIPSDRPRYVSGDNARLVQCVANVLSNAAKYTDAAGEIRVEMRDDASSASVTITDNGVGISRELLPRIFDLFVQSDRTLDRSEGGLGIGLSVVHRLIEMHGGQVTAVSEGPGRGSTFEIRLPLIAAPRAIASQALRPMVQSRRVLVVDDNADAANSLASILKLDGHVTESVYSAGDALGRAGVFNADVVLLDIGLPEMDGYEVARRIRSGGSAVVLVALTGYGQADDVRRALAAGFDAHLVKPVDFAALDKILALSPVLGASGSEPLRLAKPVDEIAVERGHDSHA